MSLRQLSFAWLDMNWYTTDPATIQNVDIFETMIMIKPDYCRKKLAQTCLAVLAIFLVVGILPDIIPTNGLKF